VTRHLSEFAARTAPSHRAAATKRPQEDEGKQEGHLTPEPPERRDHDEIGHGKHDEKPKQELRPFSLVVIPHSSPSSSLAHAHLPTLIYLSSLPSPNSDKPPPASPTPALLVTLPTSSETRLASALHVPRTGALGILEGAPGADALVTYVRETVAPVECKWIEEGLKVGWKGAKISFS
jgi:ribonuclease P/MRP protein subunit POP3